MGEPSPGGSTLHHLDVHKPPCQGLLLKHRKLSAQSWWEQRAASFEFHRQWEGPGRFQPHPGPPPEHPSLPQCLKAHFPSETPHPFEWKRLQESTPGDSYAFSMPLPVGEGNSCCSSLSHSCDSQQLPDRALGKSKAPREVSDSAAEEC